MKCRNLRQLLDGPRYGALSLSAKGWPFAKQTTQLTYFYYEEKNQICQYQSDTVLVFITKILAMHCKILPVSRLRRQFFSKLKTGLFPPAGNMENCAV